MTEAVKRVYAFGKDANGNNVTEGNTEMKWVLGGKGANLAEMANIGLPVPPGFTITCQTCMEYANAGNVWPEGALDTIAEYRADLEERMGKRLGDAEDPLLVSVRSGAPFSMPGMMDTVLNLGLNDESINGLIKQTDNPRFAWDSYRRFIQMFSNVVMGLDGDLFENAIVAMKNDRGVASDTDLTAEDLQELVDEFKAIFAENVDGEAYPSLVVDGAVAFPQDPMVQLQLAIEAVFGSWNNPRAVLYRQKEKIADDFSAAAPGEVLVTDITEFRLPDDPRKVYLSPAVDLFDGDVAAFSVGTSPSKALVAEMLAGAVAAAGGGFTLHSDRGWHYRTPDWVRACGEAGVERSMSRKGHSPDNAACEGFFGRLKVEFFHGRDWRGVSAERFAAELAEWIRWYREGRLKAFDEGGRKVYDTIAGRRRRLGLAA